jgi:hypothetical protein
MADKYVLRTNIKTLIEREGDQYGDYITPVRPLPHYTIQFFEIWASDEESGNNFRCLYSRAIGMNNENSACVGVYNMLYFNDFNKSTYGGGVYRVNWKDINKDQLEFLVDFYEMIPVPQFKLPNGQVMNRYHATSGANLVTWTLRRSGIVNPIACYSHAERESMALFENPKNWWKGNF